MFRVFFNFPPKCFVIKIETRKDLPIFVSRKKLVKKSWSNRSQMMLKNYRTPRSKGNQCRDSSRYAKQWFRFDDRFLCQIAHKEKLGKPY